ncbi:hypothetical protein [Microbacterium sp.]|uniref:hypothetical protein n=1 Tax=Microbacterium sp. TaxID=51671 RepID=UPI0037370CD6
MSPPADDAVGWSAGAEEGFELFVGQVLALFPLRVRRHRGTGLPPPSIRRIFPRSPGPSHHIATDADRAPARTRTYAVHADAPGHGFLAIGDYQVEVVILPLDERTPPQATVFRVAAISGRTINVTGVVVEPPMDAAGSA